MGKKYSEGDIIPCDDANDKCPECGRKGLFWDPLDSNTEYAWSTATCPDCGLVFDEIFKISHRQVVSEAEIMANGQRRGR